MDTAGMALTAGDTAQWLQVNLPTSPGVGNALRIIGSDGPAGAGMQVEVNGQTLFSLPLWQRPWLAIGGGAGPLSIEVDSGTTSARPSMVVGGQSNTAGRWGGP